MCILNALFDFECPHLIGVAPCCTHPSYNRCCTLEAEKLGELPKRPLIVATLRSRERFLFSLQRFRLRASSCLKVGLNRLTMLAEKLSWLREALPGVEDEDGQVGCFF